MDKQDYVVLVDLPNGMRIAGQHRAKGEIVQMTADEAYHLILDGAVALHTSHPAPSDGAH